MSLRALLLVLVLVPLSGAEEDPADPRAGEAGAFKGKTLTEAVALLGDRAGNAGFGKLVFAQRCQRCHAPEAGITAIGPFLGLVADQQDRTALLKSIIMPGADLAFGYEMRRFIMTDGKTFEGSQVEDTADAIKIATVKGEMRTLVKDNIKEEERLGTSLMPVDACRAITVDQMAHLLAFIETLKSKAP